MQSYQIRREKNTKRTDNIDTIQFNAAANKSVRERGIEERDNKQASAVQSSELLKLTSASSWNDPDKNPFLSLSVIISFVY